VKPGLS